MTTDQPEKLSVSQVAREDEAVIELASVHEDFVAKHEVPERGRHSSRWLSEHLDDDDVIVDLAGSTHFHVPTNSDG